MVSRLKPIEVFLIEVLIYFLIWLANNYLGFMLALIFGIIFISILIIALLVEWVEKSKVPKWYYWFMFVSFLAPFFTILLTILISGLPSWLTNS